MRAERKPRGGAPGRLFAEIAGAAACGATRSVTELAREHPARRPRGAAGGFLARQSTLCGQQERLGLVGEHPEEPALPHQSLLTPALCTPDNPRNLESLVTCLKAPVVKRKLEHLISPRLGFCSSKLQGVQVEVMRGKRGCPRMAEVWEGGHLL